jgi:vacuolar-type H+-ATPase subunit H
VDQVVEAGKQAQKQLEGLSEEQRKQIEEAVKQAEGGREELLQRAKALEVPKANLELFKKYEADIKKYAMGGLEWLSL